MVDVKMTSNRPYLVRAFYEWITENQLTPYIVIDTNIPNVEVPQDYIEDGKIILNVSPNATRTLQLANRYIEFEASFNGRVYHIYSPIHAVLAIYAYENGRGIVFDQEDDDGDDEPPLSRGGKNGKPKLTVVK